VFLNPEFQVCNKAIQIDDMATDPMSARPTPFKENICAIVVTYYPGQGLGDRIDLTKAQVAHVIIVDNASDDETFKRVQAGLGKPGIDVIRNPVNFGIAAALNQGVTWARSQGYKWVLLLDQDSVPAPDMVATLIGAFNEFPDRGELAIIGLNRVLNPVPRAQRNQSGWWGIAETVITSGSLLDVGAAQRIGPFREEFFIDCVDFEYCLRARSMGFKIVEILVPIMQHFIGAPKTARLLWLKLHAYNHRPWRSYYIVRNFMALIREYALKDPWWIFRMSCAVTRIMAVTLLTEESRVSKFRYMLLGFYDGLLGHFNRKVI
jgi:rhamnosyltransferase